MTQSLDKKYPGRTVRREGDQIIVTIPVKFYRRNGRQLVSANTNIGATSSQSEPNSTLVAAIAKAWAWQEELESGQFSSTEELAHSKNVDRTYANRLMRLTSLSPELAEIILSGDESDGLSLRRLHKGIPNCWSQQKQIFASTSRNKWI